ncbi:hypothetical protein D9V28_05905 [Mycetocola zhadangensis]|uniref:DNA-binding protein n=1 Tax=Mycetocola zhadangensis TaxID=1164595 RepID=A0A3L7J7B3_9MICO|nr:hypothetical protein D9V28_05905 [Mycetocola zhadangensis]
MAAPTEFPRELGNVARRALAENGYTRFDQLTTVTTAELLDLHGIGAKSIRILSECLAQRGLAFREIS